MSASRTKAAVRSTSVYRATVSIRVPVSAAMSRTAWISRIAASPRLTMAIRLNTPPGPSGRSTVYLPRHHGPGSVPPSRIPDGNAMVRLAEAAPPQFVGNNQKPRRGPGGACGGVRVVDEDHSGEGSSTSHAPPALTRVSVVVSGVPVEVTCTVVVVTFAESYTVATWAVAARLERM